MPEPFKLIFNPTLIERIAGHLEKSSIFDRDAFLHHSLTGLDDLEMMERSAQITKAMELSLPEDYQAVLDAFHAALHPDTERELSDLISDDHGLLGWALTPFGTYISLNGQENPGESLDFLRAMTMRSSAEFAVRPCSIAITPI